MANRRIKHFYNQYRGQVDDTTKDYDTEVIPELETVERRAKHMMEPKTIDINGWIFGPVKKTKKDELEEYLSSGVLTFGTEAEQDTFDVMSYWKANMAVYPTLARVYFNLASIPGMSVEPERVFSG